MSCTEFTTITNENKRLSRDERHIIERKLREGPSKAEIARLLGRDNSTIKRKIARGTVRQIKRNPYVSKKPDAPEFLEYEEYFADAGQRGYDKHRRIAGIAAVRTKYSNASRW
jgi:IS30 family transposase